MEMRVGCCSCDGCRDFDRIWILGFVPYELGRERDDDKCRVRGDPDTSFGPWDFLETLLDDLKEEDLLECRNARRVLAETNDYPINDGVEVAVSQDGYTQYSREYEKKELRLSGVAVELKKKEHGR